mmetsp:Transcript_26995/g.57837  ORF Transcript_26995/g.57837 Transcript_26995/m.57837 type:complete len:598 (+) Transcript_26995:95-1888(+)|eukprot:CAMPEP_0172313208 /NCGR_PEP_ID=MMETSP1058-20130122/19663_1 /TAXON_ID=83371 /ORGANISM="Detonula confervacea, Strain CCMP 353" /LENGTH=597 /DNA_ID=CAMNT_0013026823 /DNA_START=85 /DNA_END=1878 /DNA_ORIENTATION=-
MSLLALIADKFELEQPDANNDTRRSRPIDEQGADTAFSLLHNDNDAGQHATEKHIHKSADSAMSISRHDKEEFEDLNGPAAADAGGVIDTDPSMSSQQETKLLITFLLMVIVGTANKVFQKLQAIPMYNYPNSLNLLQNFVYVPLCFAYILPVSRFGLMNNAIPAEMTKMSKKPFVIMGFLDCLTCMLLTFAAVYLPGSLLILLPQAAIPISMILSKKMKGDRYAKYQYMGALVVVLGILVVLEPLVTQRHVSDFTCEAYDQDEFCALCEEEMTAEGCLSHRTEGTSKSNSGGSFLVQPWDERADDHVILRSLAQSNSSASAADDHFGELCNWVPTDSAQPSSSGSTETTLLWSIVTILACIPMTLSSIYKEMALSGSQTDIDPIFLNGWVAFFQLLFSFPLSIPAGMTSNPPVTPQDLPKNIFDGIKCYLGISTITSGCHPDDNCHDSPLYVNVFLVFNVCFNILIVYILKFGSANVLFMASTVMVPIGNLAFALPFMPGSTPLKDSDIAGLMVILLGLVTYRFGNTFKFGASHWRTIPPLPWRRGKTRYRRDPGILNEEQFAWDAPVFDDDNGSDLNGIRATSSLFEEPLLTPVQ